MLYPLQHRGDGAFQYPANVVEEIAAAIRVILTTIPGEHQRIPEFGNYAALLVFNNPGPDLEATISGLVKYDIENWEPRAKVEEVTTTYDYDSSSYRVKIIWSSPEIGLKETRETEVTLGGGV
ncbi:GPW/gp25 family protein [Biomaibacter acetigenes]|uniref:GPW/gp25 family protein n=1 Tax=Biomaibacter acetigenes TaxID=2316383 RepID=UPI0013CF0867|nr:GPW/gp25 family protein [Biomaibacter acetigenes]